MTRDVWAVAADTDLETAIWLLRDKQISGLPVLDASGRLAGVVSKTDLITQTPAAASRPGRRVYFRIVGGHPECATAPADLPPVRGTVEDVMTPFALTITPDVGILAGARLLLADCVHRLIVVDRGHVVGVITPLDLLRAFVSVVDEARRPSRGGPPQDAVTPPR